MRKEKNRIRLFPEYFDRDVSRRAGRRLSKNKSIRDPKLLELKLAAQKMKLETEILPEVAHPGFSTNKKGMLIVTIPDDQELTKTGVIKRISELTISFSRPLIEAKLKEQAENKKAEGKKHPTRNETQKGSDKLKRGPKPRRR